MEDVSRMVDSVLYGSEMDDEEYAAYVSGGGRRRYGRLSTSRMSNASYYSENDCGERAAPRLPWVLLARATTVQKQTTWSCCFATAVQCHARAVRQRIHGAKRYAMGKSIAGGRVPHSLHFPRRLQRSCPLLPHRLSRWPRLPILAISRRYASLKYTPLPPSPIPLFSCITRRPVQAAARPPPLQ